MFQGSRFEQLMVEREFQDVMSSVENNVLIIRCNYSRTTITSSTLQEKYSWDTASEILCEYTENVMNNIPITHLKIHPKKPSNDNHQTQMPLPLNLQEELAT